MKLYCYSIIIIIIIIIAVGLDWLPVLQGNLLRQSSALSMEATGFA